jgi:protein-L-isoaspartate O-methyltransferase
MKYDAHIEGRHYDLAFEKGMSSRDEAYGGASFQERYDDPELGDLVRKAGIRAHASILVIGTGTGADACWLADHGFRVTGIDFVQKAVTMAARIASARGSAVAYHCDDVCNAKDSYGLFDAIIDSYCLQSIVSDADRARDYAFVRSHLEADGREFVPVRRHHTVDTLCAELHANGFRIVEAEGIPVDGALRVVARKERGGAA